jgi:hypothetical protein
MKRDHKSLLCHVFFNFEQFRSPHEKANAPTRQGIFYNIDFSCSDGTALHTKSRSEGVKAPRRCLVKA